MYLGSDFHRFWARCGSQEVHPDDVPFLTSSPFVHGVRPCPFDGPLERARVVICLANPSYDSKINKNNLNALIMAMRSGEEELPGMFDTYYRRITRPIGVPLVNLQQRVAVFNVCPYASGTMPERAVKKAAGLPSVWQAQKYLREVLIPRAQTGNIYLLLIRKLQLWGITPTAEIDGNLRVIENRALGAMMPQSLGDEIRLWLTSKGHISSGQDQPNSV